MGRCYQILLKLPLLFFLAMDPLLGEIVWWPVTTSAWG